MSGKVLSGGDLEEVQERARAKQAELEKQVYVTDDHIVIHVHNEYDIALERCDTPEKIVSWCLHLTEKTWMTTDVLRRFIRLAASENNLKLPGL